MADINQKEIEKLIHDRKSRVAITQKSHLWFFNVYFNHYILYPFADFHYEMFKLTEDEKISSALIMAFRGSAKSTSSLFHIPSGPSWENRRKSLS